MKSSLESLAVPVLIWSLMFCEVVPPEKFSACWAVTVLPFRPNDTLFELLKTKALRLFDVVPALRLTFVRLVAIEPVIVLPLKPKLTLLELLNVTADRFWLVVPAEKFTDPCVEATVAVAVTVEPLKPNDTLLLFEKTKADKF